MTRQTLYAARSALAHRFPDGLTGPGRRCSVAPVHFVIMGCGRVGASLARAIERAGPRGRRHRPGRGRVPSAGHGFEGRTVTGVGFDRDTLRAAGIDNAYAFAAVTSGDNSNILAARVAREKFGVENVVARIYDPGRAEIYQRLGIPTVATVKWTSDQMLRRLLPQGHVPEFTDPSGKVVIAEMPVSTGLGRPPDQRDRAGRRTAASPTSPASATGCCPGPTPSTRRATSSTSRSRARTSRPRSASSTRAPPAH